MGRYHARDLLKVPCLLSAARVPLAAAFPLVIGSPAAAVGVVALSGATDVADGWLARRTGQVTATGAALDPVTDKIFVATVVVTLVLAHRLAPIDVLLLSLREVGELPLVAWVLVSPKARKRRTEHPTANIPGKIATMLQFATIGAALFGSSLVKPLVYATAVAGAAAAASYWGRAVRAAR